MLPKFHVRELFILLIAVAVSVHAIASDSGPAIVKTAGAVSINGTRALRVSALLSRDVVQTTTDSSAAISSKGTLVRVLPNSTLVWGRVMELQAGSLSVRTDSGITVVVEAHRIVPIRKDTRFIVTREDRCSYISVQDGSVNVEEGSKSDTVLAGGTRSFGNVANHKCNAAMAGVSSKNGVTPGRAAVGIGAAGILIGLPRVRPISPSSSD